MMEWATGLCVAPTNHDAPAAVGARLGVGARSTMGCSRSWRAAVVACALVLGAVVSPPARAQEPSEPSLSWEVLFGPQAHGSRPSLLSFRPDGEELAYLWSGALWLMSTSSGRASELVRLSALDLPGPVRPPASLQWSADGKDLLLVHDGDLFLYTVHSRPAGNRQLLRLTRTEAEEEDPKFSPDGKAVAFVRQEDLFLQPLLTRRETALTQDGETNRTLNGKTDWVYWEELWGRNSTGYWFSPGGERVAYYRFDETPVRTYPLVDFQSVYPQVEEQKYPTAGEANPRVQVGVLELASGETTWMETGSADVYLARVSWGPDGESLFVHRLNRDQDRLDVLRCRPGDGRCTTVLTESSSTWVDVEDDFAFLPDGRLVWGSDRSGWRRLYLYELPGLDSGQAKLVRALTPDTLSVTSLDGLDLETGSILYTAYATGGLGAAERQVYRTHLERSENVAVAADPGWNTAQSAPGGAVWVHSWSDSQSPPRHTLRRADGSEIAPLPYAAPEGYDPESLPQWERFTIADPKGARLPAALLRPVGAVAGRRYPVIMYHYGCPASQVVENRWRTSPRELWHRRMAERGYLVLKVDNLASLFFGKRGAERLHRRFGDLEVEAQVAAVDYLRSRADVDGGRIGLWGWSGGGANTLYSLFRRPGLWKAGVSGAPVTDWYLYDTIWTERYLDHPARNADGYRASSPITFASELKDRLLVVHGTADDNVHPHNTLMLVQKLIEAEIPFEQAIYPRQKHGFRGAHQRHFHRRMEDFFDRHLSAATE